MKFRIIKAIFKKQVLDTLKNFSILLQFIMFPIFAFILTKTIVESNPQLPSDYFIIMFSSMYVGMSPAVAIEGIISEEKEKGSLRSLLMNNVKPLDYLLGVGLYVLVMCLIGTGILAFGGGYEGEELLKFFGIMSIGIICSILLGSIVGITSKNQVSGHSLIIPITVVIAFLPLIASFNEKFKKISQYFYSQKVQDVISNLSTYQPDRKDILIIIANIVILLSLFLYFYKKKTMYED